MGLPSDTRVTYQDQSLVRTDIHSKCFSIRITIPTVVPKRIISFLNVSAIVRTWWWYIKIKLEMANPINAVNYMGPVHIQNVRVQTFLNFEDKKNPQIWFDLKNQVW